MLFILPLTALNRNDLPRAGGKGANLGEMLRAGLPVPPGFCVLTDAYRAFVAANALDAEILAGCAAADPTVPAALEAASAAIRARFESGVMPPEISAEILAAYQELVNASTQGADSLTPPSPLTGKGAGGMGMAVRSSATAEDLPDLSFAGQQDTYLNVVGEEALLQAVVRCWGSLWTARAIGYRARNIISNSDVSLAVVVQIMVPSESSGVLFTVNPLTGKRSETAIDATFGLGEALVSGQVEPDHYVVEGGRIIERFLGAKSLSIRGQAGGGTQTIAEQAADRQALPDEAILALTELGQRAASHFGSPQDIEWAAVSAHPALRAPDGEWGVAASAPPQGGLASESPALRAPEPMVLRAPEAGSGARSMGEWGVAALAAGVASPVKIWLVQSRPITSLFPLPPSRRDPDHLMVLLNFGAVQGLMDPVTPLGRSLFQHLVPAIAHLFGSAWTPESQTLTYETAERLFFDINGALRHGVGRKMALTFLPFVEPGSVETVHAYLNDPRMAVRQGGHMGLSTRLHLIRTLGPNVLRVFSNLLFPAARRRHIQNKIEKVVRTFEAERRRMAVDPAGAVAFLEYSLQIMPRRMVFWLISMVVSGQVGFQGLRQLVKGLPDGQRLTLEVTRSLPHNVTTEMDLALWNTAQAIRRDPAGAAYFQSIPAERLSADFLAGRMPAAVQTALAGFMDVYGVRGVGEIDLGRIRWFEDPTPVMQSLGSYLKIDRPDAAPDVVFARGAEAAQRAVDELAARMRHEKGGWFRAHLVRFLAHRVRELTGLRESPKLTIIRIFAQIRAGLLEAGAVWTAAGWLRQAEDFAMLRIEELRQLAKDAAQPAAGQREREKWLALVAERRAAYEHERRRRQSPRLLMGDGTALYEGVGGRPQAGEKVLVGSPVSPGQVEGIVHVVLDPFGAQLAPGEILVCPGTDPAWTPLFLAAGGLVMEVGGLMTHGSVVAREYGIPAVVGVGQATLRLKTGARIRVDGSAGTVEILE